MQSYRSIPVVFVMLLLLGMTSHAGFAVGQDTFPPIAPPHGDEDRKLPNGKSQKDTMAKYDHERALKEAEDLLTMAQQLKDEIQRAGDHVVPLSSIKKTEEIEKMAKRIRGRLTQ